jgi:hypothetical protein
MGAIYGEEYEKNINVLFGPSRIASTAKKFAELEKTSGPYKFGMLAKVLVPRPADWADEYGSTKGYGAWDKHSGDIPKELQDRLTEVIASNLRSENPRPMRIKVGANVDGSHDLQIKTFTHDGVEHIGILMLCPNPALESRSQSDAVAKTAAEVVG